jgi:ATP sulfurylase
MENDIFNNILIGYVVVMVVVGTVTTMNYLERIIGRFAKKILGKYLIRKRHKHNMILIRKRMNKPRGL